MIQRGIVGIGFQPIFNTLSVSMNLMQSIEELHRNVEDNRNGDRLNVIKSTVTELESKVDDIINIIRTSIEDNLNNCFKKWESG